MKRWKKLRLILLTMVCAIALFGMQAQAKAISASQVTGIWDGQYTGSYGHTLTKRHLTFVISKCSSAGLCSGTVYISEISGSSYQVNGSYTFTGTVNMSSGTFRAKPGSWKKKISNFEKSYFSGTLNASAKTLKGYRLDNFNDTRTNMAFSLKRISSSKSLNQITFVALNKSSASVKKGSSFTLKYSYMPSSLKGVKITWSSSNSAVAKVSGGKVTGKKAGTATITCKATYRGKSVKATCKVTVTAGTTATYTQTGTITNATDGKVLKSATINFRKGYNNKSGSIYKKTTSNSKGRYSVKLAKGQYTMQVKKSGYITSYYNLNCTKNNTSYSNNSSLSKTMASGTYRIVLTWGATPRDLDSHLTGPLSSGRFHIYFPSSNRNAYNNSNHVANLDVDDTTSYGPETVTFYPSRTASGTYRYYVHDYTNRNSSSTSYLAKSGAKVVVYKGSKQVATYKVPTSKGGNLWHVFDIVNGSIKKVNTVGYTSDYRNLP
ncbi:MAG: Ig-like domain-containing protein [Eubacteriales bacterium]|nr:Ig-like domain-containing protein [Eubacteriales bacterium]